MNMETQQVVLKKYTKPGPDCIVNVQVSDILEGMEYNDDSFN